MSKTTKTAARKGDKKKPQVKLVDPTRVALDAHANRLRDLEEWAIGLKRRIEAIEQAAKPKDPPPAEKWIPKVGDYFVPVRKNTSGWPGWSSAMDALIGTVRKIEGFQPEHRDGITTIGCSEWDWRVADCRPATPEEVAEHLRKKQEEKEAKVTELRVKRIAELKKELAELEAQS